MKKQHSKALLISAILGLIYIIYIVCHFSNAIFGSTTAEGAAGGAIATALVTPHMLLVALAVIFNWIAYFTNVRGLALTGAILYCVGGVLFILYLIFVVPSLILSFVGFSKLKNLNGDNNGGNTQA